MNGCSCETKIEVLPWPHTSAQVDNTVHVLLTNGFERNTLELGSTRDQINWMS